MKTVNEKIEERVEELYEDADALSEFLDIWVQKSRETVKETLETLIDEPPHEWGYDSFLKSTSEVLKEAFEEYCREKALSEYESAMEDK